MDDFFLGSQHHVVVPNPKERFHSSLAMIDAMKEQARQSRRTCGQMTFFLSHAFIIIYLSWALLPALSYFDPIVPPQDRRDDVQHPPTHHHSQYQYYNYLIRVSNSWAAYIPTYLALLFLFVPPLYMGLNMKSVPADDDIHWIWDTRSNTSKNSSYQDDNYKTLIEPTTEKFIIEDGHSFAVDYSLPEICDVDVRTINSRVHRKMMNATFSSSAVAGMGSESGQSHR
jgi:hypothetical protein